MVFYAVVFGLLAIFVVVAVIMKMRGSRRRYAADEGVAGTAHPHAGADGHVTSHHPHTTEAARRTRKAKRAESRRDRRHRK